MWAAPVAAARLGFVRTRNVAWLARARRAARVGFVRSGRIGAEVVAGRVPALRFVRIERSARDHTCADYSALLSWDVTVRAANPATGRYSITDSRNFFQTPARDCRSKARGMPSCGQSLYSPSYDRTTCSSKGSLLARRRSKLPSCIVGPSGASLAATIRPRPQSPGTERVCCPKRRLNSSEQTRSPLEHSLARNAQATPTQGAPGSHNLRFLLATQTQFPVLCSSLRADFRLRIAANDNNGTPAADVRYSLCGPRLFLWIAYDRLRVPVSALL